MNCGTWAWTDTLANKKGRANVAALNIDTRTIFAPHSGTTCLTVTESRRQYFASLAVISGALWGHGNQSPLPTWSLEDTGAAFVVKDSSGQKLVIFITRRSPAGEIGCRAADQGGGAASLPGPSRTWRPS